MSSLPESSPLMVTDFPMFASPLGVVLIGCLPEGQINGIVNHPRLAPPRLPAKLRVKSWTGSEFWLPALLETLLHTTGCLYYPSNVRSCFGGYGSTRAIFGFSLRNGRLHAAGPSCCSRPKQRAAIVSGRTGSSGHQQRGCFQQQFRP